MSVFDSFLKTAGDLLTMSSDLKRMDSRIDKLTEDCRSLDRRLMKIELMVDLAKQTTRRRNAKELP